MKPYGQLKPATLMPASACCMNHLICSGASLLLRIGLRLGHADASLFHGYEGQKTGPLDWPPPILAGLELHINISFRAPFASTIERSRGIFSSSESRSS
jgi:hypothetical protein